MDTGPSLLVLFPDAPEIDPDGLAAALRVYHPSLADVRVEGPVARWGAHAVRFVPVNAPVPAEVMDTCLKPAHLHAELKDVAYRQRGHVVLYHVGPVDDALEQYVALAAVAAAMVRFDAAFVLNETARAAVPVGVLLPDPDRPGEDMMDYLRALPIPLLYGGFVKLEVEGTPGVWMRTYGNHALKLPDLATLVPGHDHGGRTFAAFANVLAYLRESGATFAPGHTMQVGPGTYLRLRLPAEDEWFLESEGEIFVAEPIRDDEVNQPRP